MAGPELHQPFAKTVWRIHGTGQGGLGCGEAQVLQGRDMDAIGGAGLGRGCPLAAARGFQRGIGIVHQGQQGLIDARAGKGCGYGIGARKGRQNSVCPKGRAFGQG